jgi:hypothetical protein
VKGRISGRIVTSVKTETANRQALAHRRYPAILRFMGGLGRIALAVCAGLAAFVVGYWVPGSLLPDGWATACGLAIGLMAAGIVWAGAGSKSDVARFAVLGAAWCGLIGFVGGFFGPMIFAPDANQGPMLGLFITGPGGFVLGGVVGALVGAGRPG